MGYAEPLALLFDPKTVERGDRGGKVRRVIGRKDSRDGKSAKARVGDIDMLPAIAIKLGDGGR